MVEDRIETNYNPLSDNILEVIDEALHTWKSQSPWAYQAKNFMIMTGITGMRLISDSIKDRYFVSPLGEEMPQHTSNIVFTTYDSRVELIHNPQLDDTRVFGIRQFDGSTEASARIQLYYAGEEIIRLSPIIIEM